MPTIAITAFRRGGKIRSFANVAAKSLKRKDDKTVKLFKLVGEDDNMATPLKQLHEEMAFIQEDKEAINKLEIGDTHICTGFDRAVNVIRLNDTDNPNFNEDIPAWPK